MQHIRPLFFWLVIPLLAGLVACEKKYPEPLPITQQVSGPITPAPVQPAAPVVVQAPQQSGGGVTDALIAGGIGYMLGSATSKPAAAPAPQVVERVIVREKTVVKPPPAPVAVVKPALAPTAKSTSYTYRPAVSTSYSYRPSYSSGRR